METTLMTPKPTLLMALAVVMCTTLTPLVSCSTGPFSIRMHPPEVIARKNSFLSLEFVGSGFHQQLRLYGNLSLVSHGSSPDSIMARVDVSVNMTSAFFFDIPEVLQNYQFTEPRRGNPVLLAMGSDVPFDIEAPIFRVPYKFNCVNLSLRIPVQPSQINPFAVLLPIHTRYDDIDVVSSFTWRTFLTPIPSFKAHCITENQVHATISTPIEASHDFHAVGDLRVERRHDTCVLFPRGVLAHLPLIYWSTVVLLFSGAAIVFIVVR